MKGSLLMPRVEAHMDMVFRNTHILFMHLRTEKKLPLSEPMKHFFFLFKV